MFKRIETKKRKMVTISIDGKEVKVPAGESVAAAVLATGFGSVRRTPISGAHRGPNCMMGVCFECLMEIDGVPNRQACQTLVREGMKVRRQQGVRKVRL